MELVGKLKEQVENSKSKEEAKDYMKKAGMILSDEELLQVSGGAGIDILKKLTDLKHQILNEENPLKRGELQKEYNELYNQYYPQSHQYGRPL